MCSLFPNCSTPPPAKYLPILSPPLQITILTTLLLTAITFNSAVIINISRDTLKTRILHFILIRHVCIADLIGAVFVLPVPLVAVVRGTWDISDSLCTLISITTATVWTMHLVAVAFYRVDRVAAVWLSTGRYPIISIATGNVVLTTTWLLVLLLATLATQIFGVAYQPTLALCIPNVPLIFFILVFSGYISGLVAITTIYILAFLRRRKRRTLQINTVTTKRRHDNKTKLFKKLHSNKRVGSMATRLLLSYSVSLGHLLLYLPSIMVVCLFKGEVLPVGVVLVVGVVVYCEFIIQPVALFFLSPRLRGELGGC